MGRRQLSREELQERRFTMRKFLKLMEAVSAHDSRHIGDERENLVREALEILRTRAVIASFRMTSHGDDDDLHGIDAFVYDFDGIAMPLQVKGSHIGVRAHRERYPDVPCVLVRRDQKSEDVAAIIAYALQIPYNPKK